MFLFKTWYKCTIMFTLNVFQAILHYEGCIFKRFFSQWNRKHREALEDNKKQVREIYLLVHSENNASFKNSKSLNIKR